MEAKCFHNVFVTELKYHSCDTFHGFMHAKNVNEMVNKI